MRSYFSYFFLAFFSAISSTPIPNESSSRIVNGYDVDITEVPYQASLRRRSTAGWVHTCGAVLIDQRAVLTAAHCVELCNLSCASNFFDTYTMQRQYKFVNNPSQLRIVCGTSSRVSGGKDIDVTKVVVHESYSPEALQNDIALLLTHKKISFKDSIRPIQYAPMDFELDDGAPALVSGFGVTNYEGAASQVLQAARVYIINQDTCVLAYFRMAEITRGMVCAMATDPPRDACQGDSGGPLVSGGYLVGLVSWGESCANTQYPGVYTRVSKYNEWITNTLDVELENI